MTGLGPTRIVERTKQLLVHCEGGAPDLFALGVIVSEMLAASAHVDPLLEAFARKLMARGRDRFASARAALLVLELIERDRDAASEMLGLPYVRPLDTAIARLRARAPTQRMPVARARRWPLLVLVILCALIEVLR